MKSKLFKIWDYFIIILIFVSIIIFFYSYSHITPKQEEDFEIVNHIVSFIFFIDLIIRLYHFKKPYLFSLNFIIDLLACSDIISPILKSLRGIKYLKISKLVRIVRILRILRIFRFLKILDKFQFKNEDKKLITSISVIIIIFFIFISIFISKYIEEKLFKIIYENYQNYNSYLLYNSLDENGNFNPEKFKNEIKKRITINYHNNINIDIGYYLIYQTNYSRYIYSKDEIDKNFFDDDKYLFKTKFYEILFLNKQKKFYQNMVELSIMAISIPFLIIILVFLNTIINKNIFEPIKYIENHILRIYDTNQAENIDIEFDEPILNNFTHKLNLFIEKFIKKQKDKE
ncbi:MAG TPA: ion transporter [bacterium]|nr:ion transporter [bacterium]HOL46557.1 ion transporter [bacterium]HPQ17872.1 ion transporter [bacterium]